MLAAFAETIRRPAPCRCRVLLLGAMCSRRARARLTSWPLCQKSRLLDGLPPRRIAQHQPTSAQMRKLLVFFGSVDSKRLGKVWVAASARGLVAVEFGISRAAFERRLSRHSIFAIRHAPRRVRLAASQIGAYLRGKRRLFNVKIDWSVMPSSFQRAALKAVMAIPYGHTSSYAQIARQIRHPRASRAVGRANATNPIPLVIPCHRVIGADGSLRGYGGVGGIRTKARLLRMEAAHAGPF